MTKKLQIIAAFVLLVMAASCSKDDAVTKSSVADITAFTVNGVEWTISGTNITHTYPTETQEGQLMPTISLSPGATVSPASGTAQNFFTEQGVTYTVTAEDGVTKKTYTAKATRTLNTAADITNFTVDYVVWTISGTDITYDYQFGTQEEQLTPEITLSPGATVSPASGVAQNFFTEQGVTYTVTAEDGVTKKTYTAKAVITPLSGETGDCIWTLTGAADNYTLAISSKSSGSGAMGDYPTTTSYPWYEYISGIKTLIIHDGVTTVSDNAFYGHSGLTSVTIGNSVITVDSSAFAYCSNLTSVTIGNSVTTIGYYAFAYCSSLTEVTIPNSVITVGYAAFRDCSSLTEVNIGNSVSIIDNLAFCRCIGLTEVTIPNSVITVDTAAFFDCSNLTSVIIGNSVTSISYTAFYGCKKLASITIPNSVTTVGDAVFYGCIGLTSVTIGSSVTAIGNYAFYSCTSLNSVTNLRTTPQSINSSVFTNVTLSTCTLKVPASSKTDYETASVWKNFGTITGI
jgi:Flp pilus assembly protein protease CpaA